MQKLIRGLFLCLALLPALPPSTRSQQPNATAGRDTTQYHLNAGTSSLQEINGERVLWLRDGVTIVHGDVIVTSDEGRQFTAQRLTRLHGNVTIDQGDMHMEGDEGEYRRFEDRARLLRNVRIIDDGFDIRCDEAVFYRTENRAWLIGNVVAADSTSTLEADSVLYDRDEQTVEVFGNVVVSNPGQGVQIHGRHGFLYRDRNEAVVDSLPRLLVDPDTKEPTTVVSDIMRFFPDDDNAIASGRVKILKGQTVTQCDSAVVRDDEKRVELYGHPLAKQENMSMSGDRMILHYNDEEINRISLIGNANMLEAPRDTLVRGRDSWVRGDSVDLFVSDNRLDSIAVHGNAKSLYFPYSPRRVESNAAGGENMFFVFTNDSLTYVKITGDVEGVYRYLDLTPNETADSLRAVIDTTLSYRSFASDAQPVEFFADTVEYYARERDLVLNGNSRIDYQNRTLLGKHVTYNADLELLDATGDPVLIEGPDKFYGDRMDYDLESEVGLVQSGSTKFMDGFYQGENIAKVGDNVLKVWNSTYTTCDLKTPHYHFSANQMKVYLDDKVVMAPIVLYVGDTPILALPFFAHNIHRGRRSGVLRPDFEFGITSSGSRFLRNIGYFWATNDYMDFTFRGNFNEDRDVSLLINNRYRKRYAFDGNVDYTMIRGLRGNPNEWTTHADHRQTFNNGLSFAANLNFISSEAAPRTVDGLDDVENVIDRSIRSNLSLRKSWGRFGFSLSASRDQNLDITSPTATKVKTVLPKVQFSLPSGTLYFGRKTEVGDKGLVERALDAVRYSVGLDFDHTITERLHDETQIVNSNQSLGLNTSMRVGFINITPSISASNRFRYEKVDTFEHIAADSTQIFAMSESNTTNEFTWRTGASARTNIYGTWYPRIGRLTGIRHTVSPSVSYSFVPPQHGRPRSQGFSFTLRNGLELKVRDGEEERKIPNVVNWSLSTSYNPDAPSRNQWSIIRSNFNTQQILNIDLSLNNSFDPYTFDVLNTGVSAGYSYSGQHRLGLVPAIERELNVVASDTTANASFETTGPPEDSVPTEEGLPFNVGMGFSFNKSSTGVPSSTFNFRGGAHLTRNWRIQYDTRYDVETREFLSNGFSIYRDLHCWEMSFHRRELAGRWEYYFKINLKSMPEIFAEQGNRGLGGAGPFGLPFQ